MGCDNDLLHLLQPWQPRASVCVWSVRRMLMPLVYFRRNYNMSNEMFISLQLREDINHTVINFYALFVIIISY